MNEYLRFFTENGVKLCAFNCISIKLMAFLHCIECTTQCRPREFMSIVLARQRPVCALLQNILVYCNWPIHVKRFILKQIFVLLIMCVYCV